ncbi:hypothetical protein BGZ94_000227, partial [Podila epigama]
MQPQGGGFQPLGQPMSLDYQRRPSTSTVTTSSSMSVNNSFGNSRHHSPNEMAEKSTDQILDSGTTPNSPIHHTPEHGRASTMPVGLPKYHKTAEELARIA